MPGDNGCPPRCATQVEEIRNALLPSLRDDGVMRPGFILETRTEQERVRLWMENHDAPARARAEISRVIIRSAGSKLLNAVIGAVSLGVGIVASYLWSHP